MKLNNRGYFIFLAVFILGIAVGFIGIQVVTDPGENVWLVDRTLLIEGDGNRIFTGAFQNRTDNPYTNLQAGRRLPGLRPTGAVSARRLPAPGWRCASPDRVPGRWAAPAPICGSLIYNIDQQCGFPLLLQIDRKILQLELQD